MMLFYILSILLYKCNNLSFADSSFQQSHTPLVATPYEPVDDNNYNGLIFQFRRSIKSDNTAIEARRRSALDKNFMRFGRSDKSLMRFGRSNNMMRFGRTDKNLVRLGRPDGFMRLGRSDPEFLNVVDQNDRLKDDMTHIQLIKPQQSVTPQNYENLGSKILRYGRAGGDGSSENGDGTENIDQGKGLLNKKKNLMRFGRADSKNLMRFGRGDSKNLMRFGRADGKSLMRFGRADKNLMRFGRADSKNLMRFGRADKNNLMRFGRADQSLMRLGRAGEIKMRLGRLDPNMIPISEIFCEDNKCILRKNGEVLEVFDVGKNLTLPSLVDKSSSNEQSASSLTTGDLLNLNKNKNLWNNQLDNSDDSSNDMDNENDYDTAYYLNMDSSSNNDDRDDYGM